MDAPVLLTRATGYIGGGSTRSSAGLLGRAYWYVLLPVHEWMFSGLLHEIARRAKSRRIEFDRDSSRWSFVWQRDRLAARSEGVTRR